MAGLCRLRGRAGQKVILIICNPLYYACSCSVAVNNCGLMHVLLSFNVDLGFTNFHLTSIMIIVLYIYIYILSIIFLIKVKYFRDHIIICFYSVNRCDVTGNPFEWLLGEIMLYKSPSPILHCIRLLIKDIAVQGY